MAKLHARPRGPSCVRSRARTCSGARAAGAGAFELAAAAHLRAEVKKQAVGRAKLGVEAFAEALLGFVKTLAENSGCAARRCAARACDGMSYAMCLRHQALHPTSSGGPAATGSLSSPPHPCSCALPTPAGPTRCSYDAQEVVIKLQEEADASPGAPVGLDIATGEPLDPSTAGIYDNYCVKRQIIQSAPVIASQLLLVDEVMRAGMNMRKR